MFNQAPTVWNPFGSIHFNGMHIPTATHSPDIGLRLLNWGRILESVVLVLFLISGHSDWQEIYCLKQNFGLKFCQRVDPWTRTKGKLKQTVNARLHHVGF